MSNTITFPTIAALTAHAVQAYKSYAGPWPEWAGTELQRTAIFAMRAANGRTGVPLHEIEDGEDWANIVHPMADRMAKSLGEDVDESWDRIAIQEIIYAALTQK